MTGKCGRLKRIYANGKAMWNRQSIRYGIRSRRVELVKEERQEREKRVAERERAVAGEGIRCEGERGGA